MPYEFAVDAEQKLVTVAFRGILEAQDIVAYTGALRDHPLFRPDFCELVDLSGVESFSLTSADQQELVLFDPFAKHSKRAFIASRDMIYGMCRVYQAVSDRPEVAIFRTHAEAIAFLQLFNGDASSPG